MKSFATSLWAIFPICPSEVEDIRILDINPKVKSIYKLAVFPKENAGGTESELYAYVDRLEEMLLKVSGVSDVNKSGYREREIHIKINPNTTRQLQVSLNEIVNSIQTRNIRSTGGTIQSLFDEQSIVTIGQFDDPMNVGDVIVRSTFTGTRVRIRDIAKVEDGFEEENIQVWVNKEKAVVLSILKNANADITATVKRIEQLLEKDREITSNRFDIRVVSDDSRSIDSLLRVVKSNAMIGFILVIIVLLIFLDFRTSFWTAFGLPMSVLMVMAFMYLTGYTLNTISLSAMIMVLGMLVDDGIVIAENVYTKKRTGMSPLQVAKEGTMAVIAPLTASHLTTIFAFLPMLMISGVMGEFISVFPVIVTAMLIASFLEATLVLPNHLAHSKTKTKAKKDWFEPVAQIYEAFLKRMLRWRYLIVVLFIGILIGAFAFSTDTLKDFVLFYDDSAEAINVDIDAPKGTSLKAMAKLSGDVEDLVLKTIPQELLVSSMATIGKHSGNELFSHERYENWATIEITLIPKSERKLTARDIIDDLRKVINVDILSQFTNIQMSEAVIGPPLGKVFNVKITGDEEQTVDRVREELEAYLATIAGVREIGSDQLEGKRELVLKFDYERLAALGLTVEDVATKVRIAYDGKIATSIQTTDQKLDFRVQVDDAFQIDENFLLQLLVLNAQGRLIRLGEVASILRKKGKANINHYDGTKAVTVTADVDDEVITSAQLTRMVTENFQDIPKRFPGIT